eukprot:11332485-Prorocentrum_lima.AAC.1
MEWQAAGPKVWAPPTTSNEDGEEEVNVMSEAEATLALETMMTLRQQISFLRSLPDGQEPAARREHELALLMAKAIPGKASKMG